MYMHIRDMGAEGGVGEILIYMSTEPYKSA